jgi:hypothetical protein
MPPQPRVSTLAACEGTGSVRHRSAQREQEAYRVSLGKLSPMEAEAAGKRMAYFLPAHRTSALAHGGVEWHLCAPLQLGKEPTPCLP